MSEIRVLDRVLEERGRQPMYKDEVLFSNLYYVSLSHALRSVAGLPPEDAQARENDNRWLLKAYPACASVPVLNFDRITAMIGTGIKSCDAFFYNFRMTDADDGFHFLVEFKNTDKQTLLKMLNPNRRNENDAILPKVRESLRSICSALLFGGAQEAESVLHNLHFFIVYNGKNNVVSPNEPRVPRASVVGRRGTRQSHASSNAAYQEPRRTENEAFRVFSKEIEALHMKPCTGKTFPGNALPMATRLKGFRDGIRYFTLFSASDFATVLRSGFFDNWQWGPYRPEP